jgi:hypothetical protein
MSVLIKNVCDFCGKETESKDFYKVKVKSDSFVTYVNFDSLMPDRQSFDICRKCVEEFRNWQRRQQ